MNIKNIIALAILVTTSICSVGASEILTNKYGSFKLSETGRVLKLSRNYQEWQPLLNIHAVKQLILFKGELFARQDGYQIVYRYEKDNWVKVESNSSQLLVVNDQLLSVSGNYGTSSLHIYNGTKTNRYGVLLEKQFDTVSNQYNGAILNISADQKCSTGVLITYIHSIFLVPEGKNISQDCL